MAAKDINPLASGDDVTGNKKSMETSAQQWVESCGVCHVGGGSLEYDRDLNWYSADSGSGDAYLMKYAKLDDTSYVTVSDGYMSSSNKAEMDCLMCHLDGSNPGASWLRTLGCDADNPIGPLYDPTCAGTPTGHENPMGRTINQAMEDGVGEYDMFNRNFALKQYKPMYAASMGAGATGKFTGTELTGVDWGPTAVVAGAIKIPGSRITATPKSENCSVCHARYDDTMGLPGMMAMKTGFGNFDLLYRPDVVDVNGDPIAGVDVPAGLGGTFQDLDTDNGPNAVNDDFFQDFGCKTGMGKRAHKVNAEGDYIGANARYGMTPMVPSTMGGTNPDGSTVPRAGDVIANKMPDIDVHNSAGMQCATCHYALGSDQPKGYLDIAAKTSHGSNYPAERVYGMDHQFAQADSFPDVKSKENLDNTMNCESCHMDQTHPNRDGAVMPLHAGFPQVHLDKIGCATCHIPETYSAPGRLKYRDYSAGFWHHAQKNVLDWNYDLMTGSHNTVPSLRRWLDKGANQTSAVKIYPVLPSIMPTWFQVVPNNNVVRSDGAKVCVDNAVDYNIIPGAAVSDSAAIGSACTGNLVTDGDLDVGTATGVVALWSSTADGGPAAAGYAGKGHINNSPVKSRDAALVADYVRDNGAWDNNTASGLGDGYCGGNPLFQMGVSDPQTTPPMLCVNGWKAGTPCMDRIDCTKFDIRVNGANTFPLFDGFQLADGWEIDTKAEVDAMLAAFAAGANTSDAKHTKYLALVQVDFDVTHGIVPKEWALGGSKRGGCVSCHSSKDPASPNYSKHSVGFFEGYVQPVDKAGFMIGAYDIVKNWTAMFADFDCTAFCGMGQQGDEAFFNPMTGEMTSGAACSQGSMFQNIDQCVGMMTQTFDAAMGFPAGTAMQMGMYDGIAGLQGFTINTLQTIGFLGCNPFGGPTSGNSPAGSVNACMPAPGLSPFFDGMMMMGGVMSTPDGLATCNETTNVCNDGFRRSGGCANDADCQGAMTNVKEIAHNPFGLILSRKEVRSRQKIDLQQGYPGDDATAGSNIRWGMSITKNPGNPAHTNVWDQAEYCIDRNPALYPNPFAPGAISCRAIPYTEAECTGKGTWMGEVGGAGFCSSAQSPDGQRHIMHLMTANQYLGYTPAKLAELVAPTTIIRTLLPLHSDHKAVPCATCHSDNAGGTNTDYSLVSAMNGEVPWFTFTTNVSGGLPTCTTACHLVASIPAASKATARISAKHAIDKNFSVALDGSKSACYGVNPATGAVTQGAKTYAWTIPGAGVDTDCATAATCTATWPAATTNIVSLKVSCTPAGSDLIENTATQAVTGFDVGAGDNIELDLSYTVNAEMVATLKTAAIDPAVYKVQILWGDGTLKSVLLVDSVPSLADFADAEIGIQHTYAASGTYSVTVTTNNAGTNSNKNTYYETIVVPVAP